MTFDVPFILLFVVTGVVVGGIIGRGVMRLISIREPAPPAADQG